MERRPDFLLAGYEDMEISTQILIRGAQARNIQIEVLDRTAHFLRLTKGNIVQYVKEATKTDLDSYMAFLIMEDKHLSRIILQAAGLSLPEGQLYRNPAEVWEQLDQISSHSVAIKPTTANFGLGITLLEKGASLQEFRQAVELAFHHSDSILIEEFVVGREYRFLVLDGQTAAVCNRLPANVIGDGSSSIEELVEQKNRDPFRGEGHRTPLEKIVLGKVEREHLQRQNLDRQSAAKEGEQIFLRSNSNVSTGGDSIDYTDRMLPDYMRLAERGAAAAGAKICGVDMIIQDPSAPPQRGNHALLELNFNPVLYIHEYPYQGTPRSVGERLLDLLGF